MDAADLRVFEAVARQGGMSRAAAELNTVQSNVTARIRHLEAELGVPLFERHARGVSLSEAGRRLLPYAGRVRQLLEEARQAALDDGRPRGPLQLGCLETTAALRLAPALVRFARDNPEVDLALTTGTTRELVEAVVDRRLEGAFVCGPLDEPALAQEVAFTEDLVVIAQPAAKPPLPRLLAQAGRFVVLRSGCSYRQRLEEVLAQQGLTRLRCLEFGTLEAIYAAVAAGLGVSLLPRALVEPLAGQGRLSLHELPAGGGRVETLLVRRRDRRPSSALLAFKALAAATPSWATAA